MGAWWKWLLPKDFGWRVMSWAMVGWWLTYLGDFW